MIKQIIFIFIFNILCFSNEILKKDILQMLSSKQKAFEYESLSLKQSLFAPILLSAKYTKANTALYGKTTTKALQATISQDIFKFGGIYYSYKLANSIKISGYSSILSQLQNLRIKAYELLYKIKQLNLKIKNKQYEIENKNIYIDILRKKYLQGLIGINKLDQELIKLNELQNLLPALFEQKNNYITEFKKLSDKKIDSTNSKRYPLLSKNQYLSNNLSLKSKKQEVDKLYYTYKTKSFSYMPTISIFGTYGWQDIKETNNFDGNTYSYGIEIKMPLYLNYYANINSDKNRYLAKKIEFNNDRIYYENRYKTVIKNIKLLDNKIKKTLEIKKRYYSIYEITKKMKKYSLKTRQDVKVLENRLKIVSNNIKIYDIDKNILINSLQLN